MLHINMGVLRGAYLTLCRLFIEIDCGYIYALHLHLCIQQMVLSKRLEVHKQCASEPIFTVYKATNLAFLNKCGVVYCEYCCLCYKLFMLLYSRSLWIKVCAICINVHVIKNVQIDPCSVSVFNCYSLVPLTATWTNLWWLSSQLLVVPPTFLTANSFGITSAKSSSPQASTAMVFILCSHKD